MGTLIKMNALLSLPKDFDRPLEVDGIYAIKKSGYRVLPFETPMEFCDYNHKYLGKVVVKEIRVFEGHTHIMFKVVKLFDEEESKVYTSNFIKAPDKKETLKKKS